MACEGGKTTNEVELMTKGKEVGISIIPTTILTAPLNKHSSLPSTPLSYYDHKHLSPSFIFQLLLQLICFSASLPLGLHQM